MHQKEQKQIVEEEVKTNKAANANTAGLNSQVRSKKQLGQGVGGVESS